MSNFHYQPIFERGVDQTSYRQLTVEGFSTVKVAGHELPKVEPTVLQLVARTAFRRRRTSASVCSPYTVAVHP